MSRHVALAIALSLFAVAVALLTGANRRPALIGASSACLVGLASIVAMGRTARAAAKPMQAALAVMALAFLVRIVLVALGTIAVVRAGQSAVAFVLAFFLPYFALAAVEGAYLHALRRGTGPTA